jgi:hypothetical protein
MGQIRDLFFCRSGLLLSWPNLYIYIYIKPFAALNQSRTGQHAAIFHHRQSKRDDDVQCGTPYHHWTQGLVGAASHRSRGQCSPTTSQPERKDSTQPNHALLIIPVAGKGTRAEKAMSGVLRREEGHAVHAPGGDWQSHPCVAERWMDALATTEPEHARVNRTDR